MEWATGEPEFLASKNLPRHTEPGAGESWAGEMISYSGLHDVPHLRSATLPGGVLACGVSVCWA